MIDMNRVRNQWKLARVLECKMSSDGVVRSIKVKYLKDGVQTMVWRSVRSVSFICIICKRGIYHRKKEIKNRARTFSDVNVRVSFHHRRPGVFSGALGAWSRLFRVDSIRRFYVNWLFRRSRVSASTALLCEATTLNRINFRRSGLFRHVRNSGIILFIDLCGFTALRPLSARYYFWVLCSSK